MNQHEENSPRQQDVSAEQQIVYLNALYAKVLLSKEHKDANGWGHARPGHPEGNLAAHMRILRDNLRVVVNYLNSLPAENQLSEEQLLAVRILIDTHDTMKPVAKSGVPISHPKSHASMASQWLKNLGGSNELCLMVALHDENHALYRMSLRGAVDQQRVNKLLYTIPDWDTYLVFQICDKVTPGRNIDSIHYLLDILAQANITYKVPARKLISVLCDHHKITFDHTKSSSSEEHGQNQLLSIKLNMLPDIIEVRNIDSLEKMNSWLKKIRQDIFDSPSNYYQSQDTTERFLQLTNKMPITYKQISDYIVVPTGIERSFPELAIRILEKLRN